MLSTAQPIAVQLRAYSVTSQRSILDVQLNNTFLLQVTAGERMNPWVATGTQPPVATRKTSFKPIPSLTYCTPTPISARITDHEPEPEYSGNYIHGNRFPPSPGGPP